MHLKHNVGCIMFNFTIYWRISAFDFFFFLLFETHFTCSAKEQKSGKSEVSFRSGHSGLIFRNIIVNVQAGLEWHKDEGEIAWKSFLWQEGIKLLSTIQLPWDRSDINNVN